MLDLRGDPIALTAALVDIPSESRDEARLADEVEDALRAQTSGFEIIRNGDAVLARTHLQRPSRVLLAGHLDTVPVAGNLPSRREGGDLYGCGTADMKSGDAVFLHLAATVADGTLTVTRRSVGAGPPPQLSVTAPDGTVSRPTLAPAGEGRATACPDIVTSPERAARARRAAGEDRRGAGRGPARGG